MVELDQNNWAVDAVVEDAVGLIATDPSEMRPVDVSLDFLHPDASVAIVHVADVETNQVQQLFLLGSGEFGRGDTRVVENHVVAKRLG